MSQPEIDSFSHSPRHHSIRAAHPGMTSHRGVAPANAILRAPCAGKSEAWLRLGARRWPVMLGRRGISHIPREGDLATPAGKLTPVCVFYRAGRATRPRTALTLHPLNPDDGWCDAPYHPLYNRFVRFPFAAGAERLWREDHAYDLLVVLDFNVHPRAQGRSSAIFLHLMHDDQRPTAGCIAMHEQHLRELLRHLAPGSTIFVR